ncbi:MAG: hypothetical protein JO154_12065 [Chitinophaga sp.]|uniref:hypothetical protein n=1 Tax=Chitinophaga sp. TaxID=1869181 RepID=UPI0025BB9EFE|nr:hypothetical protein [Chitinophaga sp.]MBV8253335.1 hypothetical protein [Chitinophaga sp.]
MATPEKHTKNFELNIESGEKGKNAALKIEGVSYDLQNSPEKIHALLDLLEMPKGSKVTINYHAASVIVR